MKKKILVGAFLLLILLTAIVFVVAAVDSYNYDMDPANGVDMLEGVGAGMLLALGILAVFCELELFYTVYYFLIKPKTVTQTLLNIFSNVSLLLVFFSKHIAKALSIHEETTVLIASFFIYAALRGVCLMVSIGSLRAEDRDKTKERKSNK